MSLVVIVAIAAGVVLANVLVLALCIAASRSDARMEALAEHARRKAASVEQVETPPTANAELKRGV